jgi:hypothetical protein
MIANVVKIVSCSVGNCVSYWIPAFFCSRYEETIRIKIFMKPLPTRRVVCKNPKLSKCVFKVQCTIKFCICIRLHNQLCMLKYLRCIYLHRTDSRRPQLMWTDNICLCVLFLSTMSAESPRKTSRQSGHVVTPQPVSDRSIIESVAGFINEVVPQVIGVLLCLYTSLSFLSHITYDSHRSWPRYPSSLCSLHADPSCIKAWEWKRLWMPSKAMSVVFRVIKNEYPYF